MSDTGFMIDGKQYPVPGIPDMDMDELQIVYDACGITLQGWAKRESENDSDRREWDEGVSSPKWMMALLHIAYQRGNPDVSAADVAKLVRKVKWLEATLPMLTAEEEAEPETPLADPTEPAPSSSTGPPSRQSSSEATPSTLPNDSSTSSDEPEVAPETTGITGSGSDADADRLRRVV